MSAPRCDFNPQGSREPRLAYLRWYVWYWKISIHKALASLDPQCLLSLLLLWHFNPQGSREPRRLTVTPGHIQFYFNPQGSREPRQYPFLADTVIRMISIHKALASLDFRAKTLYIQGNRFQSTRLSRASTEDYAKVIGNIYISIHKALASLDGKNAQLFLHLCHIYMLHIIHLLQIVYQVEISSRNLIVFSGQL